MTLATAVACAVVACSSSPPPPPPPNSCDDGSHIEPAWTADPHFCLIRFADNILFPRQIALAPNGDLFVAMTTGEILVVWDEDGNKWSDSAERALFGTIPAGNHGLAVTKTHVYASSPSTLYRWKYTAGQRAATEAPEIVVDGIRIGAHQTRTPIFDSQGRLYLSIGSNSNVDRSFTDGVPPQDQGVILRYDLTTIPAGGFTPADGEVFAMGLRNEVGLAFDSRGRLWGVENGSDDMVDAAGTDIHLDNPAEEVNLFDIARPGRHYGFPVCWSEGLLTGPTARGPGTQHLELFNADRYTEEKCQNKDLIVPPAFSLRAHLAPLGIVEYQGTAYPRAYVGNLFITSHGSWNHVEGGQVGRTIIRLRPDGGGPAQGENFLGGVDDTGGLKEGTWGYRPLSIVIDPAGLLTFSDDGGGAIHKIGYRP